MRFLFLLALILLSGCTTGSFNPETNEFSFYSTKEYKTFEMSFKDAHREISIKATGVGAFKGREIVFDGIGEAVKSASGE